MGQIVDIVPNHMGIRSTTNRWWWDVLAHGAASEHAVAFDIDWEPPDPASAGRVVLPFLDRPVDEAVTQGAITLDELGGEVVARHHGDVWPVSESSLAGLGIDRQDLSRVNGDPAALGRVLARQHWRAEHWMRTAELLNWRRFFDVTDLASVRVERADVFDRVHALLQRWFVDDGLAARVVQGVRVDHVDGLVDPGGYLERLRALVGSDRLLVVEKILAADEELPESWPVDGTTGYEVSARFGEILTDTTGARTLVATTAEATGVADTWPVVEQACRALVADTLLVPEVERLGRSFAAAVTAVTGDEPDTGSARRAVAALAEELDVYRTYARPGEAPATVDDRSHIDAALVRALARHPDDPTAELLDQAAAMVRGDTPAPAPVATFVARFGQLSAPLAAKAVEDTGFYRYVALPWLNEVGGDPARLDVSVAESQEALRHLAVAWPGTMSPLTTHDTKRGADVRARLTVLASDPATFTAAVADWHLGSAPHREAGAPRPALEWLLWATIVGAWPIDAERLSTYATKAMREAKDATSWVSPDAAYEDAVHRFVAGVLGDPAIVGSVDRYVRGIRTAGRARSLAQVVLAATAVGSPDIYQGDELWNLVLVDPDNRRPVDHGLRADLLDAVEGDYGPEDLSGLWSATTDDPDDVGLVKMAVWARLLGHRRDHPAQYGPDLLPLPVSGPDAEAVVAQRRPDGPLTVIPARWLPGPAPDATVELPPGEWVDLFTRAGHRGGPVPVGLVLDRFPVSVLVAL